MIFQKKDASKLGDLKFAKFPRILTIVAIIGVVYDLNLCLGSTSITYESYLNLVVLNWFQKMLVFLISTSRQLSIALQLVHIRKI